MSLRPVSLSVESKSLRNELLKPRPVIVTVPLDKTRLGSWGFMTQPRQMVASTDASHTSVPHYKKSSLSGRGSLTRGLSLNDYKAKGTQNQGEQYLRKLRMGIEKVEKSSMAYLRIR